MPDGNVEGLKDPASLVTFFSSPRGFGAALALLVVIAGFLLFGNLAQVGLWEPWEASEILVAQEYTDRDAFEFDASDLSQPGYNWAVPTLDGKPVAQPLLKTWLMAGALKVAGAGEEPQVGPLELASRLPMAVATFLLILLGFLWIRRFYGTWQALVASIVVVTTPAIFLGGHFVSSEMLLVVTTSAAILAFVQLLYAEDKKLLWGPVFGLCMALAILEQRLLGLYLPLFVIVGFALTQLPYLEARRVRDGTDKEKLVGPLELGLCVAGLIAIGGTIIWGMGRSSDYEEGLFLPHVVQWLSALVPLFLIVSGALLARKTDVIRALVGVPGTVAGVIALIPLIAVAAAYGAVNPTLLMDGEVVGKIPVLTYFLENHLFATSLASEHQHFALWMRQIGFATLPWVTLIPLGLGYLARSTRLEGDDEEAIEGILDPKVAIHRLLLVWVFVGLVGIAAASVHGHYFYPAYFPLLVGVGLMISDGEFWSWMRSRPLVMHAMGLTAVLVIMMLGKDLERFPSRLIELYVTLEKDFALPETFEYGRTLKGLKYGTMLLLAVYFGGLVSFGILFLRDLRAFPGRAKTWWKTRKERRGQAQVMDVQERRNVAQERAQAKEDFRDGDGIFALIARWVERPAGFCVFICGAFLVFASAITFVFVPELTHHLSERGVFETYLAVAEDGEELHRYQVSDGQTSVYLEGTGTIAGTQPFLKAFEEEARLFAVIPRDRLAAVNYEVRNRHKKNLTVLDARSSRLLLVSNQLKDGEEDQNFVAAAIVEDESEIQHRVTFTHEGEEKPAVFDNQLELVGYNLDRPVDAEGVATYKWGEEMTLTTYFRVLRRVPTQQRIFLHVDYPGNRLHGDHDPVGGEFPTNFWSVGDIVKDEFTLTVDRYSSVGVYNINMGFFRGSNRMKIEPRPAHDGQNRVRVGQIKVEAF